MSASTAASMAGFISSGIYDRNLPSSVPALYSRQPASWSTSILSALITNSPIDNVGAWRSGPAEDPLEKEETPALESDGKETDGALRCGTTSEFAGAIMNVLSRP